MKIDVQLIPSFVPVDLLSRRVVVVIDVLRATSVIVQALSRGAKEVRPVGTIDEALQLATKFPREEVLLGGERGSKRIEGFDLGNSPMEYTEERVRGKRLILTTTNGTKAFHAVASGRRVFAGSFLNITAVADKCIELDEDLLIYPSGDEGRFSLEDTVCAGMVIDRVMKGEKKPLKLTDAARCAHILFQKFEAEVVSSFFLSEHGQDLADRGFEEDLFFCAQADTTDVIPIFEEGVIR